MRSNTVEKLHAGDKIEIWCMGKTVPGAWLESAIAEEYEDGYFGLMNVLVSGEMLTVARKNLRKVKQPLSASLEVHAVPRVLLPILDTAPSRTPSCVIV